MYSFQALQVLIFLIPGFLAVIVLSALIIRRPEINEWSHVIQSLVFSMLIYFLYSVLFTTSPITAFEDPDTHVIAVGYDVWGFLWLTTLSVLMPLVLAYAINRDMFMYVARYMRITQRTGRLSVWLDAFNEKPGSWIMVALKDGRRFYGYPRHYSDDPDNPLVYLTHPSIIEKDPDTQKDTFKRLNVDGMLILAASDIDNLLFMSKKE